MVENDTLTYHVKRSPSDQAKTAELSLITQERIQKLDLLLHLLANLSQSLVVCGPDGIGKTTLLNVLQKRKINSWLYCLVQGDADLSFEKILGQITEVMNLGKPKSGSSLPVALGQYESQNKKIILMIDDAGDLVPGLITTLIQYAAANPVLRVVFVLTHDDLYVKNRTDRDIEDCHFVEIPPLTEKQCGEFLQHLAAKPLPPIAFKSISDSLIEKIYRETHGIPGKIILELPDLADRKASHNPTAILVSAVAALVIIALAIQWYSASNRTEVKNPAAVETDRQPPKRVPVPAPALPQPKPASVLKSESPLLSEQFGPENSPALFSGQQQVNQPVWEQTKAGAVKESPADAAALGVAESKPGETANVENAGPKSENKPQLEGIKESATANNTAIEAPSLTKPDTAQQSQSNENDVVSEEEPGEETAAAEDGADWIMSQPPENFTLQVMVLTKEQAIKDVIIKHNTLGQALTYIKTVAPNGREKFLLLYGSFASSESANKSKHSLPPEFRQSYARKFSSIKNEAKPSR